MTWINSKQVKQEGQVLESGDLIHIWPVKLRFYYKFKPIDPNPYIVGPPIDPDVGAPFVGRPDIIDWIKDQLQQEQTRILVLYGQPRTGKSSL